jgi:hypothetical protein
MRTEIDKELESYKSDKLMSQRAIESVQHEMSEKLKGELGNDMLAVLNGERIIKVSKTDKIKFKLLNEIKKFLSIFTN